MSCFISELLIPENSDGLLLSCCRKCRFSKQCPCVCDQALYRAANRGRAAARLLTERADRLLKAVSDAEGIHGLLEADETMECALSQALCLELVQLYDLCVQTERRAEEKLFRIMQ